MTISKSTDMTSAKVKPIKATRATPRYATCGPPVAKAPRSEEPMKRAPVTTAKTSRA